MFDGGASALGGIKADETASEVEKQWEGAR